MYILATDVDGLSCDEIGTSVSGLSSSAFFEAKMSFWPDVVCWGAGVLSSYAFFVAALFFKIPCNTISFVMQQSPNCTRRECDLVSASGSPSATKQEEPRRGLEPLSLAELADSSWSSSSSAKGIGCGRS